MTCSRLVISSVTAAVLVGAAIPVNAQSILDGGARLAPQYIAYELGAPFERRVSQLAIPIAVVLPVARSVTLDIGTAWASSEATGYGVESRITGLTDTQLRASWTLGADAVVLTAGMNLPTGRSMVTESQIDAAGLIGNDFLAFPISNMGTGFGGTGGIAVARQLGEWSLGIGASLRYSGAYEPFEIDGTRAHYEPGNEYRLRVGGEHPLLGGRVALGTTLAMFGADAAGGTTYSTGTRYIVQGAWAGGVRGVALSIAAWNLTRGEGETVGGTAPWENVSNLLIAGALDVGGARVEPSLELRAWMRDAGEQASGLHRGNNLGRLATLGVRGQVHALGVLVTPGVGYTRGGVQAGAERAELTGWRVVVGVRR